jgi:hypothetical protein
LHLGRLSHLDLLEESHVSPAYRHALGFIGCYQQSCPLKLGQGIDEATDRDPPVFVKGQLGVNAPLSGNEQLLEERVDGLWFSLRLGRLSR